jgi:tape measure domain-containing protein
VALELQISTQSAQSQIEAASAAIRDFISVTQQLSRGVENIDAFAASLNSVRPINPEVVASITAIADASAALAGASANVERFAAALNGVGSGGASQAATAISQVSQAAASVEGAQIDALAAGMSNAGRAASAAVNPMTAVMSASAGVGTSLDRVAQGMAAAGQASATTGAQLDRVALGMTQAGQAASAGAGQMTNLGNAAAGAGNSAENAGREYSVFSGILQAMAFSYAIEGFRNLVEGATEASSAVQRMQIQIDTSTGIAGAGAQAYQHLADRAIALGVPIEALTSSFGRFVNAMTAGGHTLEQSQQVYDNFSGVFRALGLSTDETQRAFIAVDQVFQKGKVQSEELVRQLGQSIPAMELLAKSMGLVDQAGNPLTAQLQKLMKAGQVTSDVFIKFSQDLAAKYAPALTQAAQTGQAAFARFEDGLFAVEKVMGDAIWHTIAGELNNFAGAAYNVNGPLQQLGAALGYIVGGVGAGLLYLVQSWAQVLGSVVGGIGLAVQAFVSLGSAIATTLLPAGSALNEVMSGIIGLVGAVAGELGPLVTVIGSAAVAWGLLGGAIARVWRVISSGAGLIASALTNPFVQWTLIAVGVVTAITAVGVAVKSLWDTLTQGGSFVDNFKNNIQGVRDFLGSLGGSIGDAIGQVNQLNPALDSTAQSSANVSHFFSVLDGNAAGLSQQMVSLTQAGNGAAVSLDDSAAGANTFAGNAATAARSAGTLSSGFLSSASSANQATIAYGRAASAAAQFAAARAAGALTSSDFGPGDTLSNSAQEWVDDSWHSPDMGSSASSGPNPAYAPSPYNTSTMDTGWMYYGGIAGRGVGRTSRGNLPHYAGGGITPDTAGGIPAMLHANEAVVPLRAGGTIPVSLTGTSAPNNDPNNNPIVTLLNQITGDDVTRDDLLGQHNDKLDLILGQLTTAFPKADTFYQNVANILNTILGAINGLPGQINVSSGGGGSSGGSISGGSISGLSSAGAGNTGTPTDINSAFRALQAQLSANDAQVNTKFYDSMAQIQLAAGAAGIHQAGGIYNPQYLQDQYNQSDTAKQNNQLSLQNQALIAQFEQQYGAGSFEKMLRNGSSGSGGTGIFGFATGSPNASKDATGGFHATLHPDEAVIPLPDGRSVPVTLPDNFSRDLQAMKAMLSVAPVTRGVSTQGGQQTVNNTHKITMNIYTPDANSFRKSQPQIIADFRGQLQRAQQTSGAIKRATEDPTKRIITKAV